MGWIRQSIEEESRIDARASAFAKIASSAAICGMGGDLPCSAALGGTVTDILSGSAALSGVIEIEGAPGKSKMLVETDLMILAALIDDKGHAQWELVDDLKLDKGQLSRQIKKLVDADFIYKGNPRPSSHKNVRSNKRPERRKETPLYINRENGNLYYIHHAVEWIFHLKGMDAPEWLKVLSLAISNMFDQGTEAVKDGIRLDPMPMKDEEVRKLINVSWRHKPYDPW